MKVLFFGDVVGKIGRRALQIIVSEMREELQPDIVVANVENLAHGTGITNRTLAEMKDAGIDCFTSGDHALDKPEGAEIIHDETVPLIGPGNYSEQAAGQGYYLFEKNGKKLLVINLIGQVFMKGEHGSPFHALEAILAEPVARQAHAILVDFHAEATSEKTAFGFFATGKVSAVLGTHTHVPTADAKILDGKTAYVSDVGMVGARDSVIGVGVEEAIERFLTDEKIRFVRPESGIAQINSVLITIDDETGAAQSIMRQDREVTVS